jgi:tripartite-type tricarboxylate transporter receptor subunit TctC
LKILAVTSPKRLAALPDVPALNDLVPGMVSVTWFGLVAPAKTPAAIAAKLSATISDILKMPEITKRFAEASADPLGNTPEEAAAWMKEESERWRAVVRAGNIKVD